ncbi:class I SAM-dependent methyltransferase [Paenibacillus sp. MMS20-IR301]|uniref:class I SAM-dependent methyltransferase n=1 Tax=Paenibacillus sp. MMS20-IR301 TaxID=2895946 RepID=UPI0028EC3C97|nr:class I SAM-dependent methyltransferase [Paenibacillus sp. MMS20-IR301]WNS41976.1 class I SAM-dependent methyltransferase [Paenibacillus sp. MMS20-IR301]
MNDSKGSACSPWEQADGDQYVLNISRKIPGYQLQYDLMDTLLAACLHKQGSPELLIVGAGGGQEILTLGRNHPDWVFTGLDPSQGMLLTAEQRLGTAGLMDRVELYHSDICSWNSSRQYDAAACMLVLHFVEGRENKLALLRSIAGRLKPGAPLCMSAINGEPGSSAWLMQMAGWRRHMLGNGIAPEQWQTFEQSFGVTSHPLPAEEMEQLLKEAGFTSASRFFGSYLIDGWAAVKAPDSLYMNG